MHLPMVSEDCIRVQFQMPLDFTIRLRSMTNSCGVPCDCIKQPMTLTFYTRQRLISIPSAFQILAEHLRGMKRQAVCNCSSQLTKKLIYKDAVQSTLNYCMATRRWNHIHTKRFSMAS